MKSFKARGIVLKETFSGESDKYVVLLLKGLGKLSVSAKGARKPNSKFLAGTQPFTYSDFVIYDGGRFYTMSQIDIIESFYGLRSDFDKLCYANYFLELCDKILLANEECDDILILLLKTLSLVSKDKVAPELAARVFEFKFLQLNGYGPETDACSECGGELVPPIFFHADGCICHQCNFAFPGAIPISPSTAQAIGYILNAAPERLFSFSAGAQTLTQLKQASKIFIDSHLNITIKSRELIDL